MILNESSFRRQRYVVHYFFYDKLVFQVQKERYLSKFRSVLIASTKTMVMSNATMIVERTNTCTHFFANVWYIVFHDDTSIWSFNMTLLSLPHNNMFLYSKSMFTYILTWNTWKSVQRAGAEQISKNRKWKCHSLLFDNGITNTCYQKTPTKRQ